MNPDKPGGRHGGREEEEEKEEEGQDEEEDIFPFAFGSPGGPGAFDFSSR